MLVLWLFFLGQAAAQSDCEQGWSYYKKHCYKHIVDRINRKNYAQIEGDCANHGAWISGIDDLEEEQFLYDISVRQGSWDSKVDAIKSTPIDPTLISNTANTNIAEMLVLGATNIGNKKFKWINSNSTYFKFCPGEPNNYWSEENTLVMQLTSPCIYDHLASGTRTPTGINGYSSYTCKKPLNCSADKLATDDGKCVCRTDYYDVSKLKFDIFGRHNRPAKNVQCVRKNPCDAVSKEDGLSIIFIVDASESISPRDWSAMLDLLSSGADVLTNKTSVGFIQFSTEVTHKEWLRNRWTKREYKQAIPSKQAWGYTNTPAALEEAGNMLKNDRNRIQIAVLITDGMPKLGKEAVQEDDIAATVAAAKKLTSSGVRLVTFGYGEVMRQPAAVDLLKNIVRNPRDDFFIDKRQACDFDRMQFFNLLYSVCRVYDREGRGNGRRHHNDDDDDY